MAVLDFLVNLAQGLSKFFADAGAEFLAWTTDIVPLALVALTVLNAIVSLIGEDRFDSFARKLTKNVFARHSVTLSCKFSNRKSLFLCFRKILARKI